MFQSMKLPKPNVGVTKQISNVSFDLFPGQSLS